MQLAKTTPEQRFDIYTDVREMIAAGFLAHVIEINGVRIVLRSLDSLDWHALRFRFHETAAPRKDAFATINPKPPKPGFLEILEKRKIETEDKAWLVAVSVWMIDGAVVPRDEEILRRVYTMCRRLPAPVIEDCFGVISGLVRKVSGAFERMASFIFENESRVLWRRERDSFLVGAQGKVRNRLINMWIDFNHLEDIYDAKKEAWELTKYTVGPHIPKSIKKVYAQDAKREKDIMARRQRAMDQTYYESLGYQFKRPDKDQAPSGPFQDWRAAETEEELQDEMRRWVAGIKDEHDAVVDEIKDRIRHSVESRREQEKERRAAFAAAMEEEGIPTTTSQLVPLVGAAGQEFLDRMRTRIPGMSHIYDDGGHNSAYDKYLAQDPSVGKLRVDSEGRVMSKVAVNDLQLLESLRRPEAGGPGSLQEQIAARRPIADFSEEEED